MTTRMGGVLGRRRKGSIVVALVAATALALSACGGSDDDGGGAAADPNQPKGDVIMLGTAPQDVGDNVAKDFNEAHPGLKLQYVFLRGSELKQRVQAETAAGKLSASLVMLPIDDQVYAWKDDGTFTKHDSKFEADYDPWFVMPGYWIGARVLDPQLVYNTDMVKEKPTSWEVINDPQYKGKVGITDAGVLAGAPTLWYDQLKEKYGPQFWPTFAANEPKIMEQTGQVLDAVISGELAMGWVYGYNTLTALAEDPKLPLGQAWLDPTPLSYSVIAILDKGPNVAGATVAYDWMASAAGQQVISRYNKSLSGNPKTEYDVDRPPINELPWVKYDVKAQTAKNPEIQKEWQQIFNRT